MNVPKVGPPAAPARSFKPARAERRHDEELFAVPGDDGAGGEHDVAEPRDEQDDEDVRAQEARLMDLCAWMIPPSMPAEEGAPEAADPTDPAAQLAPPAPTTEGLAKPAAPGPQEPAAAPRQAAPDVAPEAPVEAPSAPREESHPPPPATAEPASDALARASARPRMRAEASPDAAPPSARPPSAAPKSPEGTPPEAAPSAPSAAQNPWAAPPSARADNALTAVRQPTRPEAGEDAAAARARLHDAMASTAHHRALRDVAHGELTVPGLGHVAVSARGARDAVDVEVRASQAATAYALHAQADALAADIRAADISVARLSFAGAGAWTPQHAPSQQQQPQREGSAGRHARDEGATAEAGALAAAPRGRVRFVL